MRGRRRERASREGEPREGARAPADYVIGQPKGCKKRSRSCFQTFWGWLRLHVPTTELGVINIALTESITSRTGKSQQMNSHHKTLTWYLAKLRQTTPLLRSWQSSARCCGFTLPLPATSSSTANTSSLPLCAPAVHPGHPKPHSAKQRQQTKHLAGF